MALNPPCSGVSPHKNKNRSMACFALIYDFMAWSRRLLLLMTLCIQKVWVQILSSVFAENRSHSDFQLLGAVLKHSPMHCSLQVSLCHSLAHRDTQFLGRLWHSGTHQRGWFFQVWNKPFPVRPCKRSDGGTNGSDLCRTGHELCSQSRADTLCAEVITATKTRYKTIWASICQYSA